MSDSPLPVAPIATGILICRDLIFTSKVTGTAQALGLRVGVVGSQDAVLKLLAEHPRRVILADLTAGDAVSPSALKLYKQASPQTALVAFGSHVDTASLAAATAAGCDVVMPRSRFSGELPQILKTYLAE